MPKSPSPAARPPVDFATLPEFRALPELAEAWQAVMDTDATYTAVHEKRLRIHRELESLVRDATDPPDADGVVTLLHEQLSLLDAEVQHADAARGAARRTFDAAYAVAVQARLPQLQAQYLTPLAAVMEQCTAVLTVARLLRPTGREQEMWRRHWQAQLDYVRALHTALHTK